MAIVKWQPFSELVSFRDAMDRLFEDSFVRPSLATTFGEEIGAPVDMYQTDKDVVVKAFLPGVKPEEVDISITGDVLTVKGEHKEEQEVKEKGYFRKELRYGTFGRSLQLPVAVKTDKADAVFENGVLTLTLPKAEEAKPKQARVKAKRVIEGKKEEK
jgi:HSP20 family protein